MDFVIFVAALRERGAKGEARNARNAGLTEASYRNGGLRVSETVNLRFKDNQVQGDFSIHSPELPDEGG